MKQLIKVKSAQVAAKEALKKENCPPPVASPPKVKAETTPLTSVIQPQKLSISIVNVKTEPEVARAPTERQPKPTPSEKSVVAAERSAKPEHLLGKRKRNVIDDESPAIKS